MNRVAHAEHGAGLSRLRRAFSALGLMLPLGALGVLLGVQYMQPNKRVLSTIAGALVFGIAWRLDLVSGIGLLLITLPYPKATTFGSTTFAFILALLVIWLLRAAQRQSAGWRRSPVDAPIAGLLITYIVSFSRVAPANLFNAIVNTELMFAGVVLFYLVVSNVRTERDLKRLHAFQLASLVTILMLSIYEVTHPQAVVIPGWIEFIGSGEVFASRNVRVGGPFFDYELLSEYCAVSSLLVALWLVRARTVTGRVLFGALLLTTVFVQFTTVTRGSVVSLGVSLAYLVWLMRKRLHFATLVIIVSAVVSGFLGMNFLVANFTRSGNLLSRFEKTEFQGLVPDTRTETWRSGLEKWMQSPILGHGPYYEHQVGTTTYWWPHCGYLYVANLVGAVGLAFFLWIILRLWLDSRPSTDRLDDPSYARAFLIIAHVQLLLFIVDQIKIDFLRNPIYQFQVWLLFANVAAASLVLRAADAKPVEQRSPR